MKRLLLFLLLIPLAFAWRGAGWRNGLEADGNFTYNDNITVNDTLKVDYITQDDNSTVIIVDELNVQDTLFAGNPLVCSTTVNALGKVLFSDDLNVADTLFAGNPLVCSTTVHGYGEVTFVDDLNVQDTLFAGNPMVCSTTVSILGVTTLSSSIVQKTKTFSVVGTSDTVSVAGVNVLLVDATGGSITIGGFAGGVTGQVLYVANIATNNLVLEDDESSGNQDIKAPAGSDLTITVEGGAVLVFGGTYWHVISESQ